MRKRLRKKRRIGEFREDAFEVVYKLTPQISTGDAEEFLWSFIEEAIEANGLACAGGGKDADWEFWVILDGRGSPSEAQRHAVGAWLARQPEVGWHQLGERFDSWYGPEPNDTGAGDTSVENRAS